MLIITHPVFQHYLNDLAIEKAGGSGSGYNATNYRFPFSTHLKWNQLYTNFKVMLSAALDEFDITVRSAKKSDVINEQNMLTRIIYYPETLGWDIAHPDQEGAVSPEDRVDIDNGTRRLAGYILRKVDPKLSNTYRSYSGAQSEYAWLFAPAKASGKRDGQSKGAKAQRIGLGPFDEPVRGALC